MLGLTELRSRAEALTTWKLALGRGVLPDAAEVEWPQEPFRSKFIVSRRLDAGLLPLPPRGCLLRLLFADCCSLSVHPHERITHTNADANTDPHHHQRQHRRQPPKHHHHQHQDALSKLEMARFTRRYPAVLESLMKQMMELVKDFEQKLLEAEAKREAAKRQQQQRRPPPPQQQQDQQQQQRREEDGEDGGEDEDREGEGGEQGGGEGEQEGPTQEQIEQMLEDAAANAQPGSNKQGKEVKITLESSEGQQRDKKVQADLDPDAAAAAAEAAEQVVKQWEQEMEQVVANLEAAQDAFGDLQELLEGEEGYALSQGVWRRGGWRELADLSRCARARRGEVARGFSFGRKVQRALSPSLLSLNSPQQHTNKHKTNTKQQTITTTGSSRPCPSCASSCARSAAAAARAHCGARPRRSSSQRRPPASCARRCTPRRRAA